MTTSAEWRARALAVSPGLHSNVKAAADWVPPVLVSAKGLRVTDADGRSYVDYTLGMGPAIWGYGHPEFEDVVRRQVGVLQTAASASAMTTLEVELAERIVARVPCAEWVRFAVSGTEANQAVLRIARAATGKQKFVRFTGHYHGWADNVVDGTEGRADGAADESFLIAWNDPAALDALLSAHADKIGLVLMEAVMCNTGCCPPKAGYLELVRELCARHGVLLCFDEVITGFRVHRSGAQGLYGVTPDLAVFGKALGGGFPLAAIAGKRDVLAVLRDNRAVIGGTFNAFPMSLAVGIATLDMLARDNGAWYARAARNQARLADGLKRIFQARGHETLLQGPTGCLYLDFNPRAVAYSPADLADSDRAKQARLRSLLLAEGVFAAGGGRWMVSGFHTETDIDDTLAAATRTADKL